MTAAGVPQVAVRNDGAVRAADLPELVERVRAALAARSGTRWVGVDGCGAAGKTTLAARLHAALPGSVVVHVDDFARPGVPTWEHDRFLAQLVEPLRAGRRARYQRWDWHADAGRAWVEVDPGRVMIIEGVSSTDVRLGIDWDCTIWVEAPPGDPAGPRPGPRR